MSLTFIVIRQFEFKVIGINYCQLSDDIIAMTINAFQNFIGFTLGCVRLEFNLIFVLKGRKIDDAKSTLSYHFMF